MFKYRASFPMPAILPFFAKEESINMNYGKRGQSALEYLMTYGWALVVIVIAVAALVVLINPSTIQGDQCDAKFGPFTISQSIVDGNSTKLVLVNQTGQGVSFDSVDIDGTENGATPFTESVTNMAGASMAANQTSTLYIDHAAVTGAYNLTYVITYDAGQLQDLTATGNCRGTI